MSASRPIVRIPQGKLRGVIEDSIIGKQYAAFKGIPYAKPPVGELRFRDPVQAEPWSSTLDASNFGPNGAQLDPQLKKIIGSEDCLYLNVYTQPDFDSSDSTPKPVMVWIHGGAFNQGSGDDTFYGPDYIVAKDVVLVTINYRLGVLGFLNLEDEVATGNQGLKDQVLALKWVQENIAHFGGDPTNVTISGSSAGASCVHLLTLSPWADGLYHKVIAQSGVALDPWSRLPYSPKVHAQKMAVALGKLTDDPKELVNFFRSIDARKLAQVDAELNAKPLYPALFLYVPSEDFNSKNRFFTKPFDTAVLSGVKVPLLLGYTTHEGMLFVEGLNDEKLKIFDSDIEEAMSPGVMKLLQDKGITPGDIRDIYFGEKAILQDTLVNYVQMQSDLQFICGVHELVEIQASRMECPTYLYRFSFDGGCSLVKTACGINMEGICHGDDLLYLLYPKILKRLGISLEAPGSPSRLVIDRVTQMWTDFAKTGNPTPAVSDLVPVIWEPVRNAENLECLEIGEDLQMGTVPNVSKRYVEKSKDKLSMPTDYTKRGQ